VRTRTRRRRRRRRRRSHCRIINTRLSYIRYIIIQHNIIQYIYICILVYIHTHSHTRTSRLNVFDDEQVFARPISTPVCRGVPIYLLLLYWRTMTDRPSTEFAVYTRYSNTGSGMPATGGVVYYIENSDFTKTSKSCLNLRKTACLYILYKYILYCVHGRCNVYMYMHYIIISLCEMFAVIKANSNLPKFFLYTRLFILCCCCCAILRFY